jgi:hypothetical protein
MTFSEWVAHRDAEILEEQKKKKRHKRRRHHPDAGTFLHWGAPWAWYGGYWGGWHSHGADHVDTSGGGGNTPVDPTGGDASSGDGGGAAAGGE